MTHIFEIQSVNQSSCPISIDPIYQRKKKKRIENIATTPIHLRIHRFTSITNGL